MRESEREVYQEERIREERALAVRRRRAQAVKARRLHRLTVILAVSAAALAAFFVCSGFFVKAASDTTFPSAHQKYFKEIQVGRDDSLWSIAEQYCSEEYENIQEYIREVCRINSIHDDTILYGEYLTIPYYSDVCL